MKKRILAFGDSNTWGYDPTNVANAPAKRFDDDVRWTGVMQSILGDGYVVINEGLNGRTTVWDDPIEEYRCGKAQIVPTMDTQAPLDLVIIMLGTNDLKCRFGVTAGDIARGAGLLVTKAMALTDDFTGSVPRVLLVCPPPLGPVSRTRMASQFGGSEEKSTRMHEYFEVVAAACGVAYLNAGDVVDLNTEDGLHLNADAHEKLGRAIAEKVRKLLG